MPIPITTEQKILLLPESVIDAGGEGAAFELGALAGKPLLVLLRVTEVIEQESLHVSIWGSRDGMDWTQKPLFLFPQIFYVGAIPAALDLTQRSEVRYLQARWEVNRWGRGYPRPHFAAGVEIQELSPGR